MHTFLQWVSCVAEYWSITTIPLRLNNFGHLLHKSKKNKKNMEYVLQTLAA